ncbi:glycosyltransferase family 2 protein [Parapedobacter tibetensis]|uniref:glycosyltransferase family 2 protein n=1 Tax=Parapedobacter tibetensis TaxID=2972951 RepID=UPI00214DC49B|nr:glycosyltransferase family 2 protein [Parapedobacter tibetensis]
MIQLLMPLFLSVLRLFRRKSKAGHAISSSADYAIIVTAYQQTEQLSSVVDSILELDYKNYLVYIVADDCDVAGLAFNSEKVIVLRPPQVLASNVKSHFYAIEHFRRSHERLTIIDSDNLVDRAYLTELNAFFDMGYQAVQGVRKAKNLDTQYACLDEAGDTYYRFIDRKLLFEAGSSAALSGSGMAFTTALYRQCLAHSELKGAGFDKVLQYEVLSRNHSIAFAEQAIVYDEKTSRTGQLVKQRSRWINTWFKYAYLGLKMFISAIYKPSVNRLLFSFMLLRPPLFILTGTAIFCMAINIFIIPWLAVLWVASGCVFFGIFAYALYYFNVDRGVYLSLLSAPKFIFYQMLALVRARRANQLSVATEHYHDKKD